LPSEGNAGRIERLADPAGNRDATPQRSELSSSVGPCRFHDAADTDVVLMNQPSLLIGVGITAAGKVGSGGAIFVDRAESSPCAQW
jgi:hypothetical protein